MSVPETREALLAAINEAVESLNSKPGAKKHTELMSHSKVSTNMQRDLVSKASKAADLDDFNQGTKVSFQVGVQTLSTRGTEVN